MLIIFIIAISLSMDAFSLALLYGTKAITKKQMLSLSIIVGIYHFFMPIFGMMLGKEIETLIKLSGNIIILVIFSIIGMDMIIESFKQKKEIKIMNLFEMVMFGFAVSIDSFSIGIGITNINKNFFLCSFIFSVTSFSFTYLGLMLGNKLNKLIGKFATIIGGFTLILLGISYII